MRGTYVTLLCVVLVVGALAFVFGRTAILPVLSVGTVSSSSPQSGGTTRAPAGLACIQDALGGVSAFAGVSSLRVIGNTKPFATSGLRPVPNKREIRIVLPNRYQRLDVQTGMPRDQVPLTSLVGFNEGVLLSQPREPDAAAAMRSARLDFVREILMRLPRELADVHLAQRTIRDDTDGEERLAIDAYGRDGLEATLLADPKTCLPLALQYRTGTGRLTARVDLSDYRLFGGIRFPTVLTTARNGEPWIEERDSDIQLNAPDADTYFASGER